MVLQAREPQAKDFLAGFFLNLLSPARAVQDAPGNRRDSNGQWKDVEAKLVGSQAEKLLIGPNELAKDRIKRILAACVKKATAELYPGLPDVHQKTFRGDV